MAQTLTSLLIHVVFSTKLRIPMIREQDEEELYKYMCGIPRNHQSPCLAINGTADHVHLLVSQSKNIALADLLEDLKKDSSKWIKKLGRIYNGFHWQDGYAAFSIGESGVETLKQYIANQKDHHKRQSFQDELRALLKKYRVEYDERYIWT